MTTPPELLEQALTAHGANLYRVALLLAGDARRADQLLRTTVGSLLESPEHPLDEPTLLTRLAAVARRREEREVEQGQRRPPRDRRAPPLYQRVQGLPFDQRLSVGLHLLLGYDLGQVARVAAADTSVAIKALIGAIRALAPAAGTSLTDRVSGELCDSVRAALIDPASRARHSGATRAHLAGCSVCRSFDQAWGDVGQAVERDLRLVLRERTLPAALEAKLVELARPRRRLALRPELRFILPPLAVLALVLALVLPGFMRPSVAVVEREAAPPADPHALVEQAITQHNRPPAYGTTVWHARFETGWYFDDNTYAPLRADLWLDRDNPARHRLQLTHSAGGAPYELQLGNGGDRLYYAIDSSYGAALYGPLWSSTEDELPLLLNEAADRAGQERALQQRMRSGPWGIPPFYLRQAAAAGDLRLLGRQRDGERTIQLISFSGVSPFGRPADAPGATAERVTVLLGIDSQDGRLRSATELVGPPGGAQVSRTTWRLVEEQWPATADQIDTAFAISRAWTGVGEFPAAARHRSADPAVPIVAADQVAAPIRLLQRSDEPMLFPASPPPGADRALLLWARTSDSRLGLPRTLIYQGAERQMILLFSYNTTGGQEGEVRAIGPWRAAFQPGRGQRYHVDLQLNDSLALNTVVAKPQGSFMIITDGAGHNTPLLLPVAIEAYGFSADEIAATIESLRPLDAAQLLEQDALFLHSGDHDPQARAALGALIADTLGLPGDQVSYTVAESFSRQRQRTTALSDPYHSPPYLGLPEMTRVDLWSHNADGPALYSRTLDPFTETELISLLLSDEGGWSYQAAGRALQVWGPGITPMAQRRPFDVQIALALLSAPDGTLELAEQSAGQTLIRHTEPAADSERYGVLLSNDGAFAPYLFDLRPERIITEILLNPDGSTYGVYIYAGEVLGNNNSPAQLVQAYVIQTRQTIAPADAPAALRGELPAADYTRQPVESDQQIIYLTSLTLDEALERTDYPLYLLPEERATVWDVEGSLAINPGPLAFDPLTNAIAAKLAVRVRMLAPSIAGGVEDELSILQGPAAPLRAYFSTQPDVPWQRSRPITVDLAGRPVSAWLCEDTLNGQSYLFAEIDDMLLVVQAAEAGFAERIIPLLSELRPVG